jgi:hypothetical protein
VGLAVHADGLRLTFSRPLDRRTAEEAARYRVDHWNYHWSADYGSKRWSVAHPEQVGQDSLPVRSAKLDDDGRTVFLRVDGIRPVMQMEIDYQLATADGSPLVGEVFNTIHRTAPSAGEP